MDLSVWDVLAAAGTKWNFLKFEPGLVGGHCIASTPIIWRTVRPNLVATPHIILSGRSVNDGMAGWTARNCP